MQTIYLKRARSRDVNTTRQNAQYNSNSKQVCYHPRSCGISIFHNIPRCLKDIIQKQSTFPVNTCLAKSKFQHTWNNSLCEHLTRGTDEYQVYEEPVLDHRTCARSYFKFTTISNDNQSKAGSTKINYGDIFVGCKREHIWIFANMFMQDGKVPTPHCLKLKTIMTYMIK